MLALRVALLHLWLFEMSHDWLCRIVGNPHDPPPSPPDATPPLPPTIKQPLLPGAPEDVGDKEFDVWLCCLGVGERWLKVHGIGRVVGLQVPCERHSLSHPLLRWLARAEAGSGDSRGMVLRLPVSVLLVFISSFTQPCFVIECGWESKVIWALFGLCHLELPKVFKSKLTVLSSQSPNGSTIKWSAPLLFWVCQGLFLPVPVCVHFVGHTLTSFLFSISSVNKFLTSILSRQVNGY